MLSQTCRRNYQRTSIRRLGHGSAGEQQAPHLGLADTHGTEGTRDHSPALAQDGNAGAGRRIQAVAAV